MNYSSIWICENKLGMPYDIQQLSMNSPKNENKGNILMNSLAGGLSGAVTRAISHPLDVLKIRFQLQIEPIKNGSKYSSISQAVVSIVKEEGISSFWSGHVPAQLLSITYGIVQFSAFEKLTEICRVTNEHLYHSHRNEINFCNGAIAAMLATFVSFPLDTIRTRLIAKQKKNNVYTGVFHAFNSMIKKEGLKSLYKGLSPTLGQIAPYAGLQFASYKWFTEYGFKKFLFIQGNDAHTNFISNLAAGSLAGLVSKTFIYPFDLIKKRLQIQGFQQHRVVFGKQMYCVGLLDCIKQTVGQEGFLALYKGLKPSLCKAVLVTALHFAVYEEIKNILSS